MNPVKMTWARGLAIFLVAVGVSFYIGNAYLDKYPPANTKTR